MGEFLSRLSSRSRLTWIIALVVFVLGASVGGYYIYKKQIFASTASKSITLTFTNYSKNTNVQTSFAAIPTLKYRCQQVTFYNLPDSTSAQSFMGRVQQGLVPNFTIYNDTTLNQQLQTLKSDPNNSKALQQINSWVLQDSYNSSCPTGSQPYDQNIEAYLASTSFGPYLKKTSGETEVPPQAVPQESSACVQFNGVKLLVKISGPVGPYSIAYSSDEGKYPTGTILARNDYLSSQHLLFGDCSGTGSPSSGNGENPAGQVGNSVPSTSNSGGTINSDDECFYNMDKGVYYAGKYNATKTTVTISWSSNQAVTPYSVGQEISREEHPDEYKSLSDCQKIANNSNPAAASGGTTCTANIDGTTWTFTKGTGTYWSTSTIPNVAESLNPCPTSKPCIELGKTGSVYNLSSQQIMVNDEPKLIECTAAGTGPETPNTTQSTRTIPLSFTANGKQVKNAAIKIWRYGADGKLDSNGPIGTKQETALDLVKYGVDATNKKYLKVTGYKIAGGKIYYANGDDENGSKALKADWNTSTSTALEFKFTNMDDSAIEDTSGCYTEECINQATAATVSNLPKGKSEIFFRAVRYSYAGAGFSDFEKFAPVGGVKYVLRFKTKTSTQNASDKKTGMLFGADKALAQEAANIVNNWTGYTCWTSTPELYSKPIARDQKPAVAGYTFNDVPMSNCFVQANDPKNNCQLNYFARQTTGATSTSGPYVLVDKPNGTRYPDSGSSNPSASDIQGCSDPTNSLETKKDNTKKTELANASSVATGKDPGDNYKCYVYQDNKYYWINSSTLIRSDGVQVTQAELAATGTARKYSEELNRDLCIKYAVTSSSNTEASNSAASTATIPQAALPWNTDRVKVFNDSIWKSFIRFFSREYTITGTIPDNGLQSGIRIAELPEGVYYVTVSKPGFNPSSFMFELDGKEKIDLKGLAIAPTSNVDEAPSINADTYSELGKGISVFLGYQFLVDRDRSAFIYTKRGNESFKYLPSVPGIGWMRDTDTPPTKTTYSKEAPGVPIFTTGTSNGTTAWNGAPQGSLGEAANKCAYLLQSKGLSDTQALIAAGGLALSTSKDKTLSTIGEVATIYALASNGGSIDAYCNGLNAQGYATSPQCTCPNGQQYCAGLPATCYTSYPLVNNLLSKFTSILK